MAIRKFKYFGISRYRNKNPQSLSEERQIPPLPLCETSHKKLKTCKMTRRKLENFKFSIKLKQKPLKFHKSKATPSPSQQEKRKEKKNTKMTRRKIENFETSKILNQKTFKVH
jgi:hypothetical protein